MEVEVTSSPGTKTKTMVKASDALADNGALYYYHSWFFWTWYEVVVPTYQNVLPMLHITTPEELDSILDCNISM